MKCALAANDSLVKADQSGASYTFPGALGLCPQWKNGSVQNDFTCQELLSACLMAHVNTAGIHIPIWLDGSAPQIGWGIDKVNYPFNEGTFFGNILATGDMAFLAKPGVVAPAGYYCDGDGFAQGINGVVAGRLGAGQANVPYKNPFGNGVLCKNSNNAIAQYSAGSGGGNPPDGYKALVTGNVAWNSAITVWRNSSYTPKFDPSFIYRLSPMSAAGKSVDIAYASQTNGTAVQQYATFDGESQKLSILASGSNWKLAMKANSNKCITPRANGTANGTQLEIQDCVGTGAQAWTVTPDVQTGSFIFRNVASGRCLDVAGGSPADWARMDLWDCQAGSNQKFKVQAY